MKRIQFVAFLSIALAIAAVAGCDRSSIESATEKATEAAKSAAGETAEGLAETAGGIAEEIGDLAPEALQSKVDEIKKMIADKETELKSVTERLKNFSPKDLMAGEGKDLKAKSEALTEEIGSLKSKLQPYLDKLAG